MWLIGAGTGYGRALSIYFLKRGFKVIISGRRESLLRELKQQLVKSGIAKTGKVSYLVYDCSEPNDPSISEFFATHVDFLAAVLFCAGRAAARVTDTPMLDLSETELMDTIDVNALGALRSVRAALPYLEKGPSGVRQVYLFSSMAGWSAKVGWGDYSISKALLNAIGRNLSQEFLERHKSNQTPLIKVLIVIASEAKTEMNQGSQISPNIANPLIEHCLDFPEFFVSGGAYFFNGELFESVLL